MIYSLYSKKISTNADSVDWLERQRFNPTVIAGEGADFGCFDCPKIQLILFFYVLIFEPKWTNPVLSRL